MTNPSWTRTACSGVNSRRTSKSREISEVSSVRMEGFSIRTCGLLNWQRLKSSTIYVTNYSSHEAPSFRYSSSIRPRNTWEILITLSSRRSFCKSKNALKKLWEKANLKSTSNGRRLKKRLRRISKRMARKMIL